MADWYVSSVTYAALASFAASTPYSVGQLIKPLTLPTNQRYVYRCTTAGTSSTEPGWPTTNNSTVTSGGATFTNVTGQAAYGWSAAAGNLYCISTQIDNRPSIGDRIFLSSDHVEAIAATWRAQFAAAQNFGLIQVISVNRGGSVPPVAADIQAGANIGAQSSFFLDGNCDMFWQGVTFTMVGAGSCALQFNNSVTKCNYLKNCAIVFNASSGSYISNSAPTKTVLDNVTMQFGHIGQSIYFSNNCQADLIWINTPAAIQGATIPTTLFRNDVSAVPAGITLRGVDFSALNTTLLGTGGGQTKLLMDSCRIASGLARYAAVTTGTSAGDEVELVNCWDGTSVINERHTVAGDISIDRSTYLTGGAQDDIGNYSLKLISSSRSDFAAMTLDAFALDVESTATGSSKTATVEIVSSGTLNNNDIRLQLQYMGTSGNSVASFGDSLASVLTATAALPASSNNWSSPPATPQKQLLQVTFIPQRAGRVRGLVRLGKQSTTVWINPQVAIA